MRFVGRQQDSVCDRDRQNGHAERLIGSIRRDCLDHVVVLGERNLRHLLHSYQIYYNEMRTHLGFAQGCARTVPSASGRPHRSEAGYTINTFDLEFPTTTRSSGRR